MISIATSLTFLLIRGTESYISEAGKFIYVDVDIDIGIVYDINID